MELEVYSASRMGEKRAQNEDVVLINRDLGLFIVCDGMGGHAAGEVAAQMGSAVIEAYISQNKNRLDSEPIEVVCEAVEKASAKIFDTAQADRSLSGMGATLSMLLVRGTKAYLAHCGDSRISLVRDGSIVRLTAEHTVGSELRREGLSAAGLSQEFGHILTKSIGNTPTVVPEMMVFDLLPNDRVVINSDGVDPVFENQKLLEHTLNLDAASLAPWMLDRASENGSSDDKSVLILQVGPPSSENERECADMITLVMKGVTNSPLLRSLGLDDIMRILPHCSLVDCYEGQHLIEDGALGNCMYVILDGLLEVRKKGQLISKLYCGAHVGEMALVSRTPRSADVFSAVKSKVLKIGREDLQALVENHPAIGCRLYRAIAAELTLRLIQMNVRGHQ